MPNPEGGPSGQEEGEISRDDAITEAKRVALEAKDGGQGPSAFVAAFLKTLDHHGQLSDMDKTLALVALSSDKKEEDALAFIDGYRTG